MPLHEKGGIRTPEPEGGISQSRHAFSFLATSKVWYLNGARRTNRRHMEKPKSMSHQPLPSLARKVEIEPTTFQEEFIELPSRPSQVIVLFN